MGEQADFLIDSMIDGWRGFRDFMPRARRAPTRVTCRKCGHPDLRWQNVKGGAWRLHEKDSTLHSCDLIQRVRRLA